MTDETTPKPTATPATPANPAGTLPAAPAAAPAAAAAPAPAPPAATEPAAAPSTAPAAPRRGASANVPRRNANAGAWRGQGDQTPKTPGKPTNRPAAGAQTPSTPGPIGTNITAARTPQPVARPQAEVTEKKVTTETTTETPEPPAEPTPGNGRRGASALLANRRGSTPSTAAKVASAVRGPSAAGLGAAATKKPLPGAAGNFLGGTQSKTTETGEPKTGGEQAKDFAKNAIKQAAKGAATGGMAGAGKGLLVAIWQSPAARTIAISTILAIVFAPLALIFGIILVASSGSASSGPDNDSMVASAQASGLSADDIAAAMKAVRDTDIPWTIYAAYKSRVGSAPDLAALSAALNQADPSRKYRDLYIGSVTNSSSLAVATNKFDAATAQKVQDTWVAAFVALGVDQGTAASVYQQARAWAFGQSGTTCSVGGAGGGTAPVSQTGPPVANLPAEGSYGGSLQTLTATQINNARMIMSATKLLFSGVSDQLQQRAAVIALSTAMQEAKFENLPQHSSDLDSAGMFQQRPSYGSEADRMLADHSSVWFLQRLAGTSDWSTAPVTVVAQEVQVSAFPDAYAQWETTIARPLVTQFWSGVPALPQPAWMLLKPITPPAGTGGSTAACGTTALAAGDPGVAGISGGGGFAPNATQVEGAIRFASAQIGKPYSSPGDSVNTWDCSGLTMAAYGSVGINIGAHIVSSQYYTMQAQGRLLPLQDAKRGDLVFWSATGAPGDFIHIAIYLGKDTTGKAKILAAPTEGENVKIQDLWTTSGTVLMNVVGRPTGTPGT